MTEKSSVLEIFQFWKKPISISMPENPPAYSEELAVGEVREIVEEALTSRFGVVRQGNKDYINGSLRNWIGKLSVYPDKIDPNITREMFHGECDLLSEELAIALLKIDFTVDSMQAPWHSYLAVSYKGHEIIIDPTIGQFIEGHNHVFVGTVGQLRNIAVDTEEGYESIWALQ